MNHSTFKLALGAAAVLFAHAAMAQVKIAYIDPLSGGAATIGEHGLKHLQYLVETINAKGGVMGGQKLEAVAYDNKGSPQESLVQVQKAIDAGVRFITQGNGSGAAIAISEFVAKYNERNPGKEVLYFNYAAVDPALTNEQVQLLALPLGRQLRHEDGRADQLHEGQAGRSRRSTSSARTTRSDSRCATRPRR